MAERKWKVARARDVKPQQGTDRDYARTYFLVPVNGLAETQTTVEFAARGGGSSLRAQRALRPYLERDEPPPRRLLVDRDGNVSELAE